MIQLPSCHVNAEIRKILRPGPPPAEVLLRVQGEHYEPSRPTTYFHMRALDRLGRVYQRRLVPGSRIAGGIVMLAEFVEECLQPRRTLAVNGRSGNGYLPQAIRVIGHDNLIAGQVTKVVPGEGFLLDAGIPVLVAAPGFPEGFYPPDQYVEFILRRPPEFLII